MIKIEVKGQEIRITTSSGALVVMDWKALTELEKAIQAIRKSQVAGTFDKLEITLP